MSWLLQRLAELARKMILTAGEPGFASLAKLFNPPSHHKCNTHPSLQLHFHAHMIQLHHDIRITCIGFCHRPISHEEATVQPAPATASVCFSTHATSAGSEDNLLHKLGSGSTPNPGQAEGQSGVKQIATGALQELHEELSTDRYAARLKGVDACLLLAAHCW